MVEFFYKLLRINRLITNHRIKFALLFLADVFNIRYLCLRFDPIVSCNLKCQMCYFSIDEWRKSHGGSFRIDQINKLSEIFFKKTYQLYIGCGAEPTLHRNYIDIINLGKEKKIPFIGLVTNGQLLSEVEIRRIIRSGLNEISISSHGVKKRTYETLMANASFDKLINLLSLLDKLKSEYQSKQPVLRINYTVNPDNLDELSDFFEVYGHFDIRILQIRPIIDLGDTIYKDKNLLPFADKYNHIIDNLYLECHKRGITLLATRIDPFITDSDNSALILNYVRRYISPQIVWEDDFDWENESLKEYSKRIKFRYTLFKNIFLSKNKISSLNDSLTYNIY